MELLQDTTIMMSTEAYDALTELTSVGVLSLDKDKNCIHYNQKWKTLVGVTGNKVEWIKKIHPDYVPLVYKTLDVQSDKSVNIKLTNGKSVSMRCRYTDDGYLCTFTCNDVREAILDELLSIQEQIHDD